MCRSSRPDRLVVHHVKDGSPCSLHGSELKVDDCAKKSLTQRVLRCCTQRSNATTKGKGKAKGTDTVQNAYIMEILDDLEMSLHPKRCEYLPSGSPETSKEVTSPHLEDSSSAALE